MNDYRTITPEEAKRLMSTLPDRLILDVREIEEYVTGHVEDAIPFTLSQIDEEFASECIPSLDTPLLVYCRSGKRSRMACQILAGLGYTRIYNFGGIEDWPYELTW